MRRSSSATEESRMKLSTRYAIFVFAATCVAAAVTFSSAPTSAQDDGWQIVRAEYGTRTQHNDVTEDRKSTRLNSSHGYISYAVFCLKKKKKKTQLPRVSHNCILRTDY